MFPFELTLPATNYDPYILLHSRSGKDLLIDYHYIFAAVNLDMGGAEIQLRDLDRSNWLLVKESAKEIYDMIYAKMNPPRPTFDLDALRKQLEEEGEPDE